VIKAPTLAIGTETLKNLTPGDAGSADDLPYAPHRAGAIKGYRYTAPPYELTLPVRLQKDAAVFTAIANAVVIEQAVARDGTLNGRAVYFLSASRGDRLEITLPPDAKAYAFLLDGQEVTVEDSAPNVKIVRLPPSAGQVAKVTVEVTYGLKQASLRQLQAPRLPESVPVQRTFWRLWAPEDYRLLSHDRNFSLEADYGASIEDLCRTAAPGHRYSGAARFATSGSSWLFERQGAASTLSVWLVTHEWFAIVLWALVLIAGVYLLRHDGYRRVQAALGVALALAILHLFRPLLVAACFDACWLPVVLVAVLWLATAFVRERRRRRAAAIEED
jgi:hypothetical protein